MRFGLLGRTLGHSYSPRIHALLGTPEYTLFEKEPQELAEFLRSDDLGGLNVTIPYKKAVIPYLDELTPLARRIGAVNTVVRRDGKLIGHNTDYFGFRSMVERSRLNVCGRKCLVLGSGGASNTACAVLGDLGAQVVVISRSGENNYENLHLHRDAAVIVNTTPVGMYPDVARAPLSLDDFPHLLGVLDVIYNPARTQLLLQSRERGLAYQNGLWMLVAQAKESAEWFTGRSIPASQIGEICDILRRETENIVLIGMPGCGKSTVGRLIAQKTGREFVDCDEEVVRLAGKSIPDLFAEDGEAAFRALETQVLATHGKRAGLVLATGGGCVTRAENEPLLRRNGRIFLLERDPATLETDGRPLSLAHTPQALYAARAPLYERFCDVHISCDSTPQAACDAVLRAMEGEV